MAKATSEWTCASVLAPDCKARATSGTGRAGTASAMRRISSAPAAATLSSPVSPMTSVIERGVPKLTVAVPKPRKRPMIR